MHQSWATTSFLSANIPISIQAKPNKRTVSYLHVCNLQARNYCRKKKKPEHKCHCEDYCCDTQEELLNGKCTNASNVAACFLERGRNAYNVPLTSLTNENNRHEYSTIKMQIYFTLIVWWLSLSLSHTLLFDQILKNNPLMILKKDNRQNAPTQTQL